jgi:RNA polymerase sigma-70 factor, ECF subfamily
LTGPRPTPDPDPALIARAQAGDRESLRGLLEVVEGPVRQWSLAMTGDPHDAADLAQEVLILLLRKLPSYRGDARFLTWVFSVTRNRALEEGRKEGRLRRKAERTEAGSRFEAGPVRGQEHEMDRGRILEVISTFVEELPERQREVFQLSELQGMSSPEVGELLGINPVSVRAALFKARRTLRLKILEGHPELVEEYLP